jgi:carbamate kinase
MDPREAGTGIEAEEKSMDECVGNFVRGCRRAVFQGGYSLHLLVPGNGPQVGRGLKRVRAGRQADPTIADVPVGYVSMETMTPLGIQLQLAIYKAIERQRHSFQECLGPEVVALASIPASFIVDPHTMQPRKPVGEPLTDDEISEKRMAGAVVSRVDHKGSRELVPSPVPLSTNPPDLLAVQRLIQNNFAVVTALGGGVPLLKGHDGTLRRVEGVIDKDLAFSRLLMDLNTIGVPFQSAAIITDAPHIVRDFAAAQAHIEDQGGYGFMTPEIFRSAMEIGDPIHRITDVELEDFMTGQLGKGIHFGGAGPKMEAAIAIVRHTGVEMVVICNADNFAEALLGDGNEGTTVVKA